jgi:hypothetical protein
MPYTLTTTISKILLIPNRINLNLINEFHDHMKSRGCSERHRNNTLQVMIGFANSSGRRTFYDIERKEQILEFLDIKIMGTKQDPDEKWITPWNHYLARIELFCRWITNRGGESSNESEWQTPSFMRIKEKKAT